MTKSLFLPFINTDELRPYFCAKRQLVTTLSEAGLLVGTKKTKYAFRDNNAPILLVAHIDTVQTPALNDDGLTGAGFDDRLGVYLADKLSMIYPKTFDMLLCDYEETGQSTAQFFKPTHDYNFIIELDRAGSGYVDYGLASASFRATFEEYTGLKHSYGSFSDICMLDQCNCSKFNLGIGYELAHSKDSWFDPLTCILQIEAMLHFVCAYKDTYFEPGIGWTYQYHRQSWKRNYNSSKTIYKWNQKTQTKVDDKDKKDEISKTGYNPDWWEKYNDRYGLNISDYELNEGTVECEHCCQYFPIDDISIVTWEGSSDKTYKMCQNCLEYCTGEDSTIKVIGAYQDELFKIEAENKDEE
jgi:hypothetical protein